MIYYHVSLEWKNIRITFKNTISYGIWISRSFLRCYVAGKKVRENSKPVRNSVLETYSNILVPLEHNLFKNVSKWVIFLWKTQIQTIKCGLNDTKKTKKKQVILIIYSFTLCTASDIVFKAFLLSLQDILYYFKSTMHSLPMRPRWFRPSAVNVLGMYL